MIISIIVVIFMIGGLAYIRDEYDRATKPKLLFQTAKNYSEILHKNFYKSFVPCIYDMRALHEAYEKGLHRLNDIELCKYFSYPKEYVIDKNEHLIVNDVDLGKWEECCLLTIPFETGSKKYGTVYNNSIRAHLIKSRHNGRMVVEEYKYSFDFTNFIGKRALEGILNEHIYKKELKIYKHIMERDTDFMVGSSKSAFTKFGYVLPQKYMDLYNEFQSNDYSSNEMREKLQNLYKESSDAYDNEMILKDATYAKRKEEQALENKERVGKFWNGQSSATINVLKGDRDDNKIMEEYEMSGFRNLDVLEKYGEEGKEIIKEYHLE